jgi:hypothetical protein
MPGSACRYYAAGRCLYTERLNPGYDESLRCRFLALWEKEFDSFLDRAEAFALDQQELAALWDRRFERLQQSGKGCEAYHPCENGGDQGCVNGCGDVCLLALPFCSGRCRHFELLRPEHDPEHHDTDKES